MDPSPDPYDVYRTLAEAFPESPKASPEPQPSPEKSPEHSPEVPKPEEHLETLYENYQKLEAALHGNPEGSPKDYFIDV